MRKSRLAFVVAVGALALAGCTGTREAEAPGLDPAIAFAGPEQIREHAQEACMVLQGELMALPQELVRNQCRCYARRTVSKMDEGEIASYRRTGLFDDTARAKALESLDACKLKRPA